MNIIEASKHSDIEFEVTYEDGVKRKSNIYFTNCNAFDSKDHLPINSLPVRLINADYKMVDEPISFAEAFESGKFMRVDVSEIAGLISGPKASELNEWHSLAAVMQLLSRDFASEEIRLILSKGKFYTQKEI